MSFSRPIILKILLVLGLFSIFFLIGVTMFQRCDVLYLNGRIYTMDEKNSIAEAIAVTDDRIVGIGAGCWLKLRFRPQQIINLQGKTVLPAFIDSHGHLLDLGLARLTVNVEKTKSSSEVAKRVADFLHKNPEQKWIRGRGWDQNLWDEKDFPTYTMLDAVSMEHPIYLLRVDGHACWVNSAAMAIAGITKATPEPRGGKILRDAKGNPTGVFIDNAIDLINVHVPPPSKEEMQKAIRKACEECLSYGIATVHDMAIDEKQLALYKELIEDGNLPIRIYAAIDGESDLWKEMAKQGPLPVYGKNMLTVRAVKYFLDGALGSRGAALFEPYTDDPGNRGITTMSAQELKDRVQYAIEHGFQVCIHAIGDRANALALDAYEQVTKFHQNKDLRLRIEHAEVLAKKDIERFARCRVIASMQPVQCTSDMWWIESRLGSERVRHAFTWRSLLNAGVPIAGGSDFPIESPDPIQGIYAACTRRDKDGVPRSAKDVEEMFLLSPEGVKDSAAFKDGWYGSEKMTREEAVRCFTTTGAYAGFEETMKGSLQKGYLADFIILSNDIFEVPITMLPEIRVEKTIIGGRILYDCDSHPSK